MMLKTPRLSLILAVRLAACTLGLATVCCAPGQLVGLSGDRAEVSPLPGQPSDPPVGEPSQDGNAHPGPPPGDANVRTCATGKLQVCDDFEADAVGQSPNAQLWTAHTQNAQESITVDSTRAYSGKQSLRIHTTNNGYEKAEIIAKTLFPAANNSFYGRFYMYLDQQPQIHTNIIRASGVQPGQTATTDCVYGGQFGPFLANYYNANDSSRVIDDWQHAGTQTNGAWQDATMVPTGRWACIEWHFKGDSNEMHLWVDGQAVTTLDVLGKSSQSNSGIPWTTPPFSEVAIGYTVIANNEKFDHFDLWVDAVAFDAQRIGCLPSSP